MYKNIVTQTLRNPLHKHRQSEVDVLRLDRLHPVISGNKWFKLKFHILQAIEQRKKGLVSFGGAYSNHLVAMAFACKEHGLMSAGIIRGEENDRDNYSIQEMRNYGMSLHFVSRESYRMKEKIAEEFISAHKEFNFVPEGGQSAEGIKGAAEILSFTQKHYTHIFCPVGTATTLAGIISSADKNTLVIGISALKVQDENNNGLLNFIKQNTQGNFSILFNYHFGGYAKKTTELIDFMNNFYAMEKIPSDFVYTGKMFYAVEDLMKNGYFEAGSKILVIHTGGLQGNRSLPAGILSF
jgi:1-aminocyclopropane-1-carboxylate deaminase